jgi:anti-sigma factor RsiW
MTEPHIADDHLVALALGQLTDRPDLEGHLATCPACRQEYDACSSAVEHVLAAAPRVEPPSGFEARLLAAMRPAPTRRPLRWLAAAAAVGVLVGGLGVAGAERLADRSPSYATTGSIALRAHGDVVGRITQTTMDGRAVAVVTVTGGTPGVHYRCRLVRSDGSTVPAGYWTMSDGGEDTWVVPLGPRVTRLELVEDSGAVWAAAPI